MSYGPIKVFSGSIASGASTVSFALDKSYSKVFAQVGTMSTNAALTVYGSTDNSTFMPVHERVNTAPVQYQAVTVATTSVGTIVPLEAPFPGLQFRASAVISGGCDIKLICID